MFNIIAVLLFSIFDQQLIEFTDAEPTNMTLQPILSFVKNIEKGPK